MSATRLRPPALGETVVTKTGTLPYWFWEKVSETGVSCFTVGTGMGCRVYWLKDYLLTWRFPFPGEAARQPGELAK